MGAQKLKKAKTDFGFEHEQSDEKLDDETNQNRAPSHVTRIMGENVEKQDEDDQT